MPFIRIPRTSLTPSSLCLGTGNLGSSLSKEESFTLLDAFVDLGGNFLDTARVYTDWLPGERSISEKTIGEWIHLRRIRNRIILATKGGHPELATMNIPRLSPRDIIGDLDASLRNLRTDRIDLYWLHRDDPGRPVGDIMDTLAARVAAGKILHLGCSNWRLERIRAAQEYAEKQGIPGFVANQMMWSLAATHPAGLPDPTMVAMDAALKKYHGESGMAAVPYSSQAGGLFQKMAGGLRDIPKIYATGENTIRFQRVLELRAQTGLSITEITLGYLLSQPFPTIPIVGFRNPSQLNDSWKGAGTRLTPEQIAFLES